MSTKKRTAHFVQSLQINTHAFNLHRFLGNRKKLKEKTIGTPDYEAFVACNECLFQRNTDKLPELINLLKNPSLQSQFSK